MKQVCPARLHRSCSPLRGSAAELLETHIGALDARIEELTAQRDELVPAFRPTLSKTCAAVEHAIAHLKTWRMLSEEGGRYRARLERYSSMIKAVIGLFFFAAYE